MAWLVCLLACAAMVTACGGAPSGPPGPARGAALNADFSGRGPGALAAAESLPNLAPNLRDASSLAARIVYVSTSGINGSHSLVTGTVFVPKGDPPAGGWKIVALAHPATGIQTQCAPSASPTLLGSAPEVEALLNAGYLVTVPDYQGLGLRDTDHSADPTIGAFNGYHPFLDSTTEGYNVIDSVRAARKLVPAASETFVVLGHGQGGQAAWAANEIATDYRGTLHLAGVVAVAPTAALDWLADAAADDSLTLDQQLTLQMFLASLANEDNDFDVDPYRHGVVKDNWDVLSACWGPAYQDRARIVQQIGPGDLRPDDGDATEALRAYLQKTSLPQAPAAAPMVIVADAQDGLVPQEQTDAAVARACAMGDVVASRPPPGPDEQKAVLGWIADFFNGAPPQNDCAVPTSGSG
jgi:hypothetical protein